MDRTSSDIARHIGQIVREERRRQDMTQEMLAFVADVSISSVYRVERGEPTVRLDMVTKVLAALGLGLEVRGR
jgi:HTH-type transcriptional regulator, cell division transcriptional repressor